jgi:hypothetical protein
LTDRDPIEAIFKGLDAPLLLFHSHLCVYSGEFPADVRSRGIRLLLPVEPTPLATHLSTAAYESIPFAFAAAYKPDRVRKGGLRVGQSTQHL